MLTPFYSGCNDWPKDLLVTHPKTFVSKMSVGCLCLCSHDLGLILFLKVRKPAGEVTKELMTAEDISRAEMDQWDEKFAKSKTEESIHEDS